MSKNNYILIYLALSLLLPACTYVPPIHPNATEEERLTIERMHEENRRDSWILTTLAIIPAAIIASK